MQHQCSGLTCEFPYCQNNPKNHTHRTEPRKRMTLAEFRTKYGTNGVSEIITYLIEHVPLSKESMKDFKQLAADIKSLLTEE